MKKRELVYVHALLGEVRRFLDEHEELPARRFADYQEYGVGPTAIHRTKGDHEEAIQILLDDLVAALRSDQSDEGTEEASATSR